MPNLLLSDAAAGWLALLALAVPVAIHLWNRRPGRTVQVGSVRWLQAAANRRLRNLRLEQLALLLLRAAIVGLVALALAGPQWQRQRPARPVRGLVLLAPEVLHPAVLPGLRPTLDSLRRRGYELRQFAPNFRPISATAWQQPDSLALLRPTAGGLPDDYWLRARQAADSFPGRPLRVLSGAALPHFRGARPALPARITWQTVPLPDSSIWLAQAGQLSTDSLRLLVGSSQEEGTTFRMVRLARPRSSGSLAVAGLPGLRYQAGSPARLQQAGQPAVPVQTEPLRVVLYADGRHAAAARYLRAALQAVAPGLARPLEIRTMTPAADLSTSPDWLFWLSDQPVPAAWLARARQGGHLWQETAAAGASVATRLHLAGLLPDAAAPVDVLQLDTSRTPTNQTVIWQTGTGQPVLLREAAGRGSRYLLRTRLQPAWTSLPETAALPTLLLHLLRTESTDAPLFAARPALAERRQLDARQLGAEPWQPVSRLPAQGKLQLPPPLLVDVRAWVVLAALLLFALERGLAYRRAAISLSSSAT
ncbi:BatA domain-containing protein [Hymenobacter canadensis]|uniref:BatA domain-containing protein n=1 Tax=Hymenobacter canadensis TaxID=2999067 RepID=A0ABY7LR40_9BACT|nr:BatA domain-containing protein [Hymenobacter canadensis]WBA41363.1 BatA domain-containing protein [Hymenobacter canadensis]